MICSRGCCHCTGTQGTSVHLFHLLFPSSGWFMPVLVLVPVWANTSAAMCCFVIQVIPIVIDFCVLLQLTSLTINLHYPPTWNFCSGGRQLQVFLQHCNNNMIGSCKGNLLNVRKYRRPVSYSTVIMCVILSYEMFTYPIISSFCPEWFWWLLELQMFSGKYLKNLCKITQARCYLRPFPGSSKRSLVRKLFTFLGYGC